MDKDRTEICEIISNMLDSPDEHEIYPTSTAYTRLELYVEQERILAIGWTLAHCCVSLDKGDDPRIQEVPAILSMALEDLAKSS
jgi:hypothetical protein